MNLGKHTLSASSSDKVDTISVEFMVNVNTSGDFTTTLSERDAKIIMGYGVYLRTNGRRNGREGYFSSDTLDGLKGQISEILKRCVGRELVSRKIVLEYAIATSCSYWLTKDDKIIPNGSWREDGEPDSDRHWQNGTLSTDACHPKPTGAHLYVRPIVQCNYKYANGDIRIEKKKTSCFGSSGFDDLEDSYYLRWLEGIASTCPPEGADIKYIDYTEDAARFFVEFYKSMCLLSKNLAQFEDGKFLEKSIELFSGTLSLEHLPSAQSITNERIEA